MLTILRNSVVTVTVAFLFAVNFQRWGFAEKRFIIGHICSENPAGTEEEKKSFMMILFLQTAIALMTGGFNQKTPSILPTAEPCFYNGVDTCLLQAKTTIRIHLAVEKQTIHSFGA